MAFRPSFFRRALLSSLTAAAGLGLPASRAQDAVESLGSLDALTVIGSTEEVFRLQGSGYFVGQDEIRNHHSNNLNRILSRVPGVYVREEGGYGNFPNISIRGGDGTRSEKLTLMEDGILTVPAPYSAPAAYFSPRVARMAGLEVLKGSSQVRYGPQTTGGVINYLSTSVPTDHHFYTRNTYGTDNAILSHSYFGDVIETQAGRFGYVLELFHNQVDGFRRIDAAADYAGSDQTGFRVTEPMIKLFWEPNGTVPQRFEFKYGFTNFDADATYAGLSEADVRATPDRRYAATRFDHMASHQHRTYLKHMIQPTDHLRFETALYYNAFERNWRKLDDIEFGADSSIRRALLDPVGLAALQGRGAGNLIIRSNARDYAAYGIQFSGQWQFATGRLDHDLGFGVRLHHDYVERDQFDDVFVQNNTGAIVDQQFQLNNVRRQESDALALWVEDAITVTDKLTLTPGVRYERIDFSQRDGTEDQSRVNTRAELLANRDAVTFANSSETVDFLAPGMSFAYELSDQSRFFGGVYRGISVPGPRSSIDGTDIEETIGYELGTRYTARGLSAELVGFFTDFQNILNTDTGTGAADAATNGGKAEVWGFEALVTYDPLFGSEATLPIYFSATWTSAEFKNRIVGGGGDNIFAGAVDGSAIPYIPEWKLAAGFGYARGRWGANFDMSFVTETFGTGNNSLAPIAGSDLGAREGEIDSLFLCDLSGHFDVTDNLRLVTGIENLFDERAIVSRIPRGPRANNGRTAYAGFEARF